MSDIMRRYEEKTRAMREEYRALQAKMCLTCGGSGEWPYVCYDDDVLFEVDGNGMPTGTIFPAKCRDCGGTGIRE